jgi:predicted ester cyclase
MTASSMERPEGVVMRFIERVLNGRDPQALVDLTSDEALKHRVGGLRDAFPDLDVKALEVVSHGEYVTVHLSGRGTHRGVFQGVPPTGRPWLTTCTALCRVENGRITESWITCDLLALMEQIGAVKRLDTASA